MASKSSSTRRVAESVYECRGLYYVRCRVGGRYYSSRAWATLAQAEIHRNHVTGRPKLPPGVYARRPHSRRHAGERWTPHRMTALTARPVAAETPNLEP